MSSVNCRETTMADSMKVFELLYDSLSVHIEADESRPVRLDVVLRADGRRFELNQGEAEALGMALIRAAEKTSWSQPSLAAAYPGGDDDG